MKKILITGANSYIGTSVEKYLEEYNDQYAITTIDVKGDAWKNFDFSKFDVVFHVAGIVHQKENKENTHLYYEVNRDLAVNVANKAKMSGVKNFIFMSSMSVYGLEYSKDNISINTIPNPITNYGKSKLEAEGMLLNMANDNFIVSILRPPMVYGENSPGNLTKLLKLVRKIHVFPIVKNERSSISIEKLCIEIKKIIDEPENKIYLPQNDEYLCTYDIIKNQMKKENVLVIYIPFLSPIIKFFVGKVTVISKVFGDLKYERNEK